MNLLEKIEQKQAVIAVIGMGYVGLPLALSFSRAGFRVIGIDTDQDKVVSLNNRKSYIEHIEDAEIDAAVEKGLVASTDFSVCADSDALIICVPTPLGQHRDPDLRFVTETMDSILPYLREGQILSLESTTYPGTTEELLMPKIEEQGLTVGEHVYLVYSPEREDPGRKDFTTTTTPKICGGVTERCLDMGVALYSQIIDKVVPVSSARAAEMTKLLENIHRAVNIGLVNEMKIIADKMDINIHEVIDAAATKPFGFVPYYPGPGLGGHCIPIDPFYLTWKAKEFGIDTKFIELAGEVNSKMPSWVVEKISQALNSKSKSIKGSSIHILGIAYKKNVGDMRETPAAKIIQLLSEQGAVVSYSDPHVPSFPKMRNYRFDMHSEELTEKALATKDVVVVVTDHDKFDYEMIFDASSLIVDTRGVYKDKQAKVVLA